MDAVLTAVFQSLPQVGVASGLIVVMVLLLRRESSTEERHAAELKRINGQWYIYFSADHGSNDTHRVYEWLLQETFDAGDALRLLARERVTEPYTLPHHTAAITPVAGASFPVGGVPGLSPVDRPVPGQLPDPVHVRLGEDVT